MRGSIVCTVAVALASGSAGVAQGQALWRQPVSLGTSSSTSYTGALAAGDGGRLLVAWTPADTGTLRESVRFRLRPNATAPFTPVKQIVPPCPTAQCGTTAFKVAMNPAGQAILVWRRQDTSTRVLTTYSATIDANGHAGAPQLVDTQSLTGVTFTGLFAIGVDDAGRAFLASADATNRPTVRIRSAAGTWGSPTVVSQAAASQYYFDAPRIAVAGGHVAIAVKMADCAILISRLGAADTWTSGSPDDEAGCDHTPSVAITPDGTTDAIWKTWRGTRFVVKTASAAPDAPFGSPEVIGDTRSYDVDPQPVVRRLSDGRVVAAWADVDIQRVDVRTRTAGVWQPVEPSGPADLLGDLAINDNGMVVVHGLGTLVARKALGAPWASRVLRPGVTETGDPAAFPGGDLAWLLRDTGTGTLWLYEFTARSLPRLVIPTPYPTAVSTRKRYVAGSLMPLEVTLNRPGETVPLRVQQLRSGHWVTIASRSVPATGRAATIRVRVRTIGITRLRVMAGTSTRVTNALTVEMRKPLHRRIGVGGSVVAGPAGVWTNEPQALRQLDPDSGATLRVIPHPDTWFRLTAAGPASLLAQDVHGARLTRIDAATGARTTRRIDGGYLSASSDGQHLWASGICPATFPDAPTEVNCLNSFAEQLDPITLVPTGVNATDPTNGISHATVTGSRVWLTASNPDAYDSSTLFSANAATGVIDPTPPLGAGRYDGGLYPLTDTVVWAGGYHGAKRLLPGPSTQILISAGYRFLDLARSGTTVWMMQRRSLPKIGMYDHRLVQYRLDGTLTGKVVQLGETTTLSATLSIHNNIAWVVNDQEAAVLRVPLPQ